MEAEPRATTSPSAACSLLGRCPLCGDPNRCRLESGEAYKGPCWCERPTVSAAALRRLLSELAEPRCLCAACLDAIAADPDVSRESLSERGSPAEDSSRPPECSAQQPSALVPLDGEYYWEGPAMVFTEKYHLRRGHCCGSGCRHCPYRS